MKYAKREEYDRNNEKKQEKNPKFHACACNDIVTVYKCKCSEG